MREGKWLGVERPGGFRGDCAVPTRPWSTEPPDRSGAIVPAPQGSTPSSPAHLTPEGAVASPLQHGGVLQRPTMARKSRRTRGLWRRPTSWEGQHSAAKGFIRASSRAPQPGDKSRPVAIMAGIFGPAVST